MLKKSARFVLASPVRLTIRNKSMPRLFACCGLAGRPFDHPASFVYYCQLREVFNILLIQVSDNRFTHLHSPDNLCSGLNIFR